VLQLSDTENFALEMKKGKLPFIFIGYTILVYQIFINIFNFII